MFTTIRRILVWNLGNMKNRTVMITCGTKFTTFNYRQFALSRLNIKPLTKHKMQTHPSISESSWLIVWLAYGCICELVLFAPTVSISSINIIHGVRILAASAKSDKLQSTWSKNTREFICKHDYNITNSHGYINFDSQL